MASPTGATFTTLPATTRPAVVGSLLTAPPTPSLSPGGISTPMANAPVPQPVGTSTPPVAPKIQTGTPPVRAGLPPVRSNANDLSGSTFAPAGAQSADARTYG